MPKPKTKIHFTELRVSMTFGQFMSYYKRKKDYQKIPQKL